jgi:hypothetical protein
MDTYIHTHKYTYINDLHICTYTHIGVYTYIHGIYVVQDLQELTLSKSKMSYF